MPCSYCQTQFSITKWKSTCNACSNKFCSDCYSGKFCKTCQDVLNTGFNYDTLMNLKAKELKNYLTFRNIDIYRYKEKRELVNALLALENNKMGNARSKKNSSYRNGPSSYPHHGNYPRQENDTSTLPPGHYPHVNGDTGTNRNNRPQGSGSSSNYPHPHPQNINDDFQSSFVPPTDVPPSYTRTQNDFSTTNDYLNNPLREIFNMFGTHIPANLDTNAFATANVSTPTMSSHSHPSETQNDVTDSTMQNPSTTGSSSPPEASRPVPTGLGGKKLIITNLKSIEQINLLNNKELKQLLADNFVDYKGCVEKSELQAKVKALFLDKSKNDADMKAAEEETEVGDKTNAAESEDKCCKICWDATIDCVFLECGHMAACTSCGKRLNECPICRQYIVRCVHVFRT